MRIALFTEVFLPKIDGVVNTLCRLLEHLAQREHTAILFAPSGGPDWYAGTRSSDCPLSRFPSIRNSGWCRPPWTCATIWLPLSRT